MSKDNLQIINDGLIARIRELENELEKYRNNNFKTVEPSLELKEYQDLLNKSVDDLPFTVRTMNCLKAVDIKSVFDIATKTELEIIKVKNLGSKGVKEIKEFFYDNGLGFDLPKEGYDSVGVGKFCYMKSLKAKLKSAEHALTVPHLANEKRRMYHELISDIKKKLKEIES